MTRAPKKWRRTLNRHARALLALVAVGPAGMHAAGGEESRPAQAGPRRTVVDPAVVPAGGCRGCNAASCRGCRARHGGHHAGCRDGACHPHCPVRPQEFGFYGTQWRRWPDGRVMPVANQEAVTPVKPPRSQVPRSEDESPRMPEEPAATEPEGQSESREKAPADGSQPATRSDATTDPPRGDLIPRGESEPVVPAKLPAQPRLLPQSLRGVPPPAIAPWRPFPDARPVDGARTIVAAPADDAIGGLHDAVAPEPASRVVAAAAETEDQEFDESSTGPARRRFVARRLPSTGGPAAAEDRGPGR